MSSIVTLTLNPALDVSTSVESLLPSKKLKCADPVMEPGGGGINVARAIKLLGGKALAVYLSGGDTGGIITRLLNGKMIDTLEVPITDISRQNFVISDRTNGKQYLLVMPGPRVNKAVCDNCLRAIEKISGMKYLILSGSLPNGCPTDLISRLAHLAHRRKAKLIVDTGGEALRQAALSGAFLIKPNLKELGFLAGRPGIGASQAAAVAREVLQHTACKVIVVSLGSKGALLVSNELCLKIAAPAVHVLSTVGAGDSLLAGLVLRLSEGKPLPEAVKYGVACGTAATLSPGSELCTKDEADRLFNLM